MAPRTTWLRFTARFVCLTLVALVTSRSIAGDPRTEQGPGGGAVVGGEGGDCGSLLLNADGTYEMAYAWQYGGVVAPDYGSVAECYSGHVEVCAAVFDLTQTGNQTGQTMDVYIWGDGGGEPGSVLCVETGIEPGPISFWPSISRHVVELANPCCTDEGEWWVGFWPDWPGELSGWFFNGDLDGFGGCPLTKVAPGIGYPTGWQNVSVIWGPTQALGLGALVRDCDPVPIRSTSWGAIKGLYE